MEQRIREPLRGDEKPKMQERSKEEKLIKGN